MRTIIAIPGVIISLLSLFFMLLGMLPFLGWLNWLNIPVAIVALLFSAIGRSRTGTIISLVVIVLGIFRLQIGFGVI